MPNGSIRRECLDRLIVIGERHLRRIPASYFHDYDRSRSHLSQGKDSPVPPAGQERQSRQDHRPSTGWRTPPSLRSTGRLNGGLTTADSNHIAPLAGSVLAAGKRGHVGPTAVWQPVGVDPFYPAIESARLRLHEGTRSALSAPSLSFSEGQAQFYTAASVLNGRHACSFFAPPTTVGYWKKLFGKVIGSQSPGTGTVPKIETRRYEAITA